MTLSFTVGPPSAEKIMVIHGLLGSSEDFRPLISFLILEFCFIGFDLPGHGKAAHLPPLSLEETATLIEEFAKNKGCKWVVGYSLGGRLALAASFSPYSFIEKVLVLSSHPGLHEIEKSQKREEENNWIQLMLKDSAAFLDKWYSQKLFSHGSKEDLIHKRRSNDFSKVAACIGLWGLSKQKNFSEKILLEKSRYLFLCGENDEKYHSLYKKKDLPFFLIANSSHAIHLDSPKECANFIRRFFIA